MPDVVRAAVPLDRAVEVTRTGDLWLFRGRKLADRAIQLATNSPVNHVGMALVVEDLPPLMWHAELGQSLPDVWTGEHQRGVQLHDLRDAVTTWAHRYGQEAWLRQLHVDVDADGRAEMEDAALRTVARLDGTPFPDTVRLAARWLWGQTPRFDRVPPRRVLRALGALGAVPGLGALRGRADPGARAAEEARLEMAYCAEIVALTYEAMGLLPGDRRAAGFDPGRFWSGDDLGLLRGAHLGDEIAVTVPPAPSVPATPSTVSPR